MKRFFSVFALLFMVILVSPHAEAKKFGGGKSMGKSFKTAPAPKSNPSSTDSLSKNKQQQGTAASATSGKKGMIGGVLGGLLAGGLLAALFAGGAFEGFQFADFIIIGLIAFAIFMLIRTLKAKKHRPAQAYAGAGGGSFDSTQSQRRQGFEQQNVNQGSAASAAINPHSVPFNYPPNFDMAAFLQGAREHYRILQQAWNKNQLATIQEYVSIELYNELAKDRAELGSEQYTEVLYVDAEAVRADYDTVKAQISLQFSGRYRDAKENIEENITDIWHLERSLTQPNAPWIIVGIEG